MKKIYTLILVVLLFNKVASCAEQTDPDPFSIFLRETSDEDWQSEDSRSTDAPLELGEELGSGSETESDDWNTPDLPKTVLHQDIPNLMPLVIYAVKTYHQKV